MYENYFNLNNRELLDLINNLPNKSLEKNIIVKDLKINNISILIYYGGDLSYPKIVLDNFNLYTEITIYIFKIENFIRKKIGLPYIRYNKIFCQSLSQEQCKEIEVLFNDGSERRYIGDVLKIIQYLSKYYNHLARLENLKSFK